MAHDPFVHSLLLLVCQLLSARPCDTQEMAPKLVKQQLDLPLGVPGRVRGFATLTQLVMQAAPGWTDLLDSCRPHLSSSELVRKIQNPPFPFPVHMFPALVCLLVWRRDWLFEAPELAAWLTCQLPGASSTIKAAPCPKTVIGDHVKAAL